MAERARAGVVAAALTMAVDHTTAEVVAAFRAAGIRSILLKGPSLACWLYSEGGRTYGDSDVLVRPDTLASAGRVLRALGFAETTRGRAEHAHTYARPEASGVPLCVDLHRSLPYVTVSGDEAWKVLSRGRASIELGGTQVDVLDVPRRCFHVAIHALQHAFESADPLEDLRRALRRAERSQWQGAVAVSRALGAEDAFAAGLCLVEEGRVLAEDLGLTTERRGILRIAASPQSEGQAYRLERIIGAPSSRERGELIFDSLFVSPPVLRRKSTLARKGRVGLWLAYVTRPLVVLAQAGPAYRRRRRILQAR